MIPIIGYSNKLSARPGETIDFKVSCSIPGTYEASLVRIRCADANPKGPGIKEELLNASFAGSYPTNFKNVNAGSHAIINDPQKLKNCSEITILANVWPTLKSKKNQTIISWVDESFTHGCLAIDPSGRVFAQLGNTTILNLTPISLHKWYHVWVSIDLKKQYASCGWCSISERIKKIHTVKDNIHLNSTSKVMFKKIIIAASYDKKPHSYFNGKIEDPCIYNISSFDNQRPNLAKNKCIANWDFSQEISSTNIIDHGPYKLNGTLINFPARAMTGSNWNGSSMDWQYKSDQYGAIHFHEDDLYDCEWETDFSYKIPKNLKSGVYAAKLKCNEHEDTIPFIVCPPRGEQNAKLCLIIPTFTYIVYANHARPNFDHSWKERAETWNVNAHNPAENKQFGLSTYNFHPDGSGICHSSLHRPMLTMRPGYFHFVDRKGSGLRHFQADTHIIDWLEEHDFSYDLVTDYEINDEGIEILRPYSTVLTGTHPEYHTKQTLDAIESFQDQGGRLIYLGGNGFYWKVALHKEKSGIIEIRRGEGGIRAWAAEPGEYYNAFDGEYGGLWRRNGRPPQKIVGVGFSAQGTFSGSYYKRSEASFDPQFDWVFAGITEKNIGNFGLSGGGAAGFELDRADSKLGTPENATILASSEGHSQDYTGNSEDFFILVPEEQLTHLTTWPGDKTDKLIRADIVFYPTNKGGAVFSVGSITFCGSLPSNDYKNNISQMLHNVITHFLKPHQNF